MLKKLFVLSLFVTGLTTVAHSAYTDTSEDNAIVRKVARLVNDAGSQGLLNRVKTADKKIIQVLSLVRNNDAGLIKLTELMRNGEVSSHQRTWSHLQKGTERLVGIENTTATVRYHKHTLDNVINEILGLLEANLTLSSESRATILQNMQLAVQRVIDHNRSLHAPSRINKLRTKHQQDVLANAKLVRKYTQLRTLLTDLLSEELYKQEEKIVQEAVSETVQTDVQETTQTTTRENT